MVGQAAQDTIKKIKCRKKYLKKIIGAHAYQQKNYEDTLAISNAIIDKCVLENKKMGYSKSDKPKKKRPPSKYNLHMKDCIADMKAKGRTDHKQNFSQCAMKWKKVK